MAPGKENFNPSRGGKTKKGPDVIKQRENKEKKKKGRIFWRSLTKVLLSPKGKGAAEENLFIMNRKKSTEEGL